MAEIRFSNRLWRVRSTGFGGPGPNQFDERNVRLLANGDVRLELVPREGVWCSGELSTVERLGFGTYQLWLIGRPDRFDPQIVFGFFSYPPSDVGPDGTHEIDIELARWGRKDAPLGNYTIYPTQAKKPSTSHSFPLVLQSDKSTYRFIRTPDKLVLSCYQGHRALGDEKGLIDRWEFTGDLSRAPMPLHINFWLFQGKPAEGAQPQALLLRRFIFEPSAAPIP
jgi:hypothetical protein